MSIKKLIKWIIKLFNYKSLFIGVLLSSIFLKLNTSFNDVVTFVIISILLIYLCIGLTYRVYQYFKKDHILMNVLILFLLSGISFIAIDIILKHQQDIPVLVGFKGDLVITYTLIALISFILVLLKLIVQFIFGIIKKRVDTFKLILAIILLFISIFIFYPPRSIANDTIKFYYQTLNPKSGLDRKSVV